MIVEPDGLLRLQVEEAVARLGCRVGAEGAAGEGPAVAFIGLDGSGLCCVAPQARRAEAGLRVGYAARARGLLGAHRLHGCCDLLLELRAGPDGPGFVHAPVSVLEAAGLTSREGDVVLLLASGSTTAEVARVLCVSPATARCHCRNILRKLGLGARRDLRRRLLGGEPEGGPHAGPATA